MYDILSIVITVGSAGLCLWWLPATIRHFLPGRLAKRWPTRDHDALQAAFFLITLNRLWLSLRHYVFGSHLEAFAGGELPYLNASLAWTVVCLVISVIVVRGYQRIPPCSP